MNLEIINIAANTKNNKDIKNHTHFIKLKNSICGDEIQIKLIIKGEKITNIGYQTYYNTQDSIDLINKLHFDSYRLGEIRQNIEEVEPSLRNARLSKH